MSTNGEYEEPEGGELAGRIRPYALTGGRTRSEFDLPLETLVRRTSQGETSINRLALERKRILEIAERPLSVVEISAELSVHVGVARVLVGDMKAGGLIDVYQPDHGAERPDIKLLERVLDGLQAL